MESTSNIVFIRLVTDVNNQGRGFELKFSASKKYILLKFKFEFSLVGHHTKSFFCILDCKRQINDLRGAIGKLEAIKTT